MTTYTINNNAVNYGNATITEVGIYGSSRVGVYRPNLETNSAPEAQVMPGLGYVAYYNRFYRGMKQFELSNLLGNVMATVTDTKIPVANNGNISYFKANVITATEYAPFGMQLQGRTYTANSSSNYRYGFNGKEMDNENLWTRK